MKLLRIQLACELRVLARNGEQLLLILGIPMLLLSFFSNVDILPTSGQSSVNFLLPGIVALAIMSTAMVSLGIATGFERSYQVLKRLGATPLGVPRLVLAKALSVLVVELVQVMLLIGLAKVFGADLGAEKFLDIKCREAGLKPDAVVLVATIRALKYHGGVAFADLGQENIPALREGIKNLKRHIENVRKYGLEPLVAINNFPTDTQAEVDALKEICGGLGVRVALSEVWAKGGDGGTEMAEALVKILQENKANFKPLYDLDLSIEAKVEKIAKEIYRADAVNFSSKAMADLRLIKKLSLEKLPVCIAKTQYSFSEDAKALGAPESFEINIRTIEIAAGAGFVVPIAGDMMRMPGLPARPAAENIDIDADGNISGLF